MSQAEREALRQTHVSAPATFRGASGPLGTTTSAGKQILLAIITFGIWSLVWTHRQHKQIKAYSGEGVGGGVGLVIALFAGIVTPFLLASEVKSHLYGRSGQESPVSAATGAWMFLPLLGSIIWYLKVQGAINAFWRSQGAK